MNSNNVEYKENLIYSKEARNAVRYGFQYRKDAESIESQRIHYYLFEPSKILIFIAEAILGGITYDLLKLIVKRTWDKIKEKKSNKEDKQVLDILTNEESLGEFFVCIREFQEKKMSITESQEIYIKEEFVADYYAEKLVNHNEQRLSKREKRIVIKEGIKEANEIIVRKK